MEADLGLDKTLRSAGSPGGSHRHTSRPYFSFPLFFPCHLPGPALQGCVAKDEMWSPYIPAQHQPAAFTAGLARVCCHLAVGAMALCFLSPLS